MKMTESVENENVSSMPKSVEPEFECSYSHFENVSWSIP